MQLIMPNVRTFILMLKTISHVTKKKAIIFSQRRNVTKIIYNNKGTPETYIEEINWILFLNMNMIVSCKGDEKHDTHQYLEIKNQFYFFYVCSTGDFLTHYIILDISL